uniref:Dimethylargininase n=2 Tax=Guillardia theta TaxID=55529 RepID=A0A7S4U720_GUITH|mmetsp:Transcript_46413/g.145595  ORF Transcript_46413/g.145595 Transcript_46413/m.145595 type:complete len:175 (+) Transcript_46413:113-637(+)
MAEESNEDVTLDGGDVLFTGRHCFVGISSRTNEAGFEFLRKHFASEFAEGAKSIHAIQVKDDLHLKSLATFAGNDQIAFDDSVGGDHFVQEVERLIGATHGYSMHRMSVHEATNVLRVGDALLVSKGCELLPEMQKLAEMAGVKRQDIVGVENSEFAKADGAITCRSLILPHLF